MKINKLDGILIWLLYVVQLGFHTYAKYDNIVSTAVTIIVFVFFVGQCGRGKIALVSCSKSILIWYTSFVGFAALSILWATSGNTYSVLNLVLQVYVPIVLTTICTSIYLCKHVGASVLYALMYAELAVAVRAIIHTPISQMISTMDSRLYGTGLGVNYNHFTTQFALVFCVALYLGLIYRKFSKTTKFIVIFLAFNILISGSRKAMIAAVIALIAMYVLGGDRNSILQKAKRTLWISCIVSILFFIVINNSFLYDLVGRKLIAVFQDIGLNSYVTSTKIVDSSSEVRHELRMLAINVFRQNPILGVGYYCFPKYNTWGIYAHNNFLEILADLGLIGFVLYYWYIFKVFLKSVYTCLTIKTDALKINTLLLVYCIVVFFIDYGHVTSIRVYSILPLVVVFMASKQMRKAAEIREG